MEYSCHKLGCKFSKKGRNECLLDQNWLLGFSSTKSSPITLTCEDNTPNVCYHKCEIHAQLFWNVYGKSVLKSFHICKFKIFCTTVNSCFNCMFHKPSCSYVTSSLCLCLRITVSTEVCTGSHTPSHFSVLHMNTPLL